MSANKISREDRERAFSVLYAAYPVLAQKVPLVIGCGPELRAILVENGFSKTKAGLYIGRYFSQPEYRRNGVAGAVRMNLDGSPSDQVVTPEQEAGVKAQMEAERAAYMAKVKAAKKAYWAARKAAKKAEEAVLTPQVASQPVAEKAAPAAPAATSRVGLNGRPILSLRRSA